MPGTGKKVIICSESGKSCFPKEEAESELIASLKFKNGGKKLKSKSKVHARTSDSALLKGTVTESPSKETNDDSARSKLVSEKCWHKELNKMSSKKLGSSKHKGKETKKLVAAEGNGEVANGDIETKKLSKRKKKKRQKEKVELDEASRMQRRTRYLLIKMKLEQNLIDAYSGEGWKGQSREKIRPEKELLRAKKQILKCKLGIRDAIQQIDSLSSVGCIEGSVIAADGSVHHEHIICAKCKLREAFPDNDIILCDGTCNCAFHQKCLDPPLDTDSIPPGDQGWFCRFCECKMEIIEAMNAHIGTSFSVNSNWQDIFKEEAAFPDDGSSLLNQEEDWPSDDSKDDDYNPERWENSCSIIGAEIDDDASSYACLSWSSGDKAFAESQRWEIEGNGCKNFSVGSSLGSDETSDGEIICGRRQRGSVDYKKLYDEMFGKDASAFEQVSEDEDWGPAKRRRREKESDAVNTLMTLYGSEEKLSGVKTSEEKKKLPSDTKIRRPFFRIPPNAVEKLRQVFAENELPSRVVKENLSKELCLKPEKVNKWFKNARYIALKTRKVERAKQIHSSRISKESRLETEKKTTTEVVALKEDALKETLASTPNNSEKIHHRKHSKSLSDSLKKNQHQRASPESPVNSNQGCVPKGYYSDSTSALQKNILEIRTMFQKMQAHRANLELSDDMSLKKLLKAKPKKEKKVDFIARDGSQVAEAEVERLCIAKRRLEILKQKLSRLLNGTAQKSNKNHLHDKSVMYVPVAELREKV